MPMAQSASVAALLLFAVVSPTADALQLLGHEVLAGHSKLAETHDILQLSATLLLLGTGVCFALGLALLTACCMYDATSNWMHRAKFHACKRKVERVNEVFQYKKGDLPLCPYCVEWITSQQSTHKVVFLCGHRFHIGCVNKWFREHTQIAGKCPVCVEASGAVESTLDGATSPEDPCRDEAQMFVLKSLHRRFPEFITKDCMKRWAPCHSEIWLAELAFPRYRSIFNRQSGSAESA